MDGRKSWSTRRVEHALAEMLNWWIACAQPNDATEEQRHAGMYTVTRKHRVFRLSGDE